MDKNIKTALMIGGGIVAIVVVVPLVFGAVFAQQDGDVGRMDVFDAGIHDSLLGLVIWGIVALVRGLSRSGGPEFASSRADSALEVLRKRYAGVR
ncbi:MAG: hypothetical protein QGI51_00285 [Dehalococcoidales bacterium]|jgi:uncharacterized membrane protein|nr:hypothetical protein [Dehalococcoidales bacterium]MDP6631927.1 hypothetical protein [Dehalococcoidales bacterium]